MDALGWDSLPPGWLTHSGWFTHISGHPSATGRAQDRESTPVEYRRSTTEPRNQPSWLRGIVQLGVTLSIAHSRISISTV